MQLTTRIKVFLKKRTPARLFEIIRSISAHTILKIEPLIFKYKIRKFTSVIQKTIYYKGGQFELILDPKNGFLDEVIFTGISYEPHIVAEFVSNIKQGDTCLDIGANIGHHTMIMSKAAGELGKVIAFEPIPKIREQLNTSLSLNKVMNVEVLPFALSNTEGESTLHINPENVAGSSFVNEENTEGIKVAVRTLDSFNYERVNFIKIDVEGFEYSVLLGALQTIKRHRPVILFEYSPLYYRKIDTALEQKILQFFNELNYTLLDLENGKSTIYQKSDFVAEFGDGLRSQTNILALP
jgi:FkbM family methyltransferase